MQQDTSAQDAVTLSQAVLGELDIPVPGYDRSQVSVGIVHFGVGGFHRAHQAMYVDRLMNEGKDLDWGICGMGVLPGDAAMKQVMAEQDHLYTLVLKHPDGTPGGCDCSPGRGAGSAVRRRTARPARTWPRARAPYGSRTRIL